MESRPAVGTVRNCMFPAAMSAACWANPSRSQPASITRDCCATPTSAPSRAGSVSVPPARTLSATAARNTCWRRMRDRSPSGSPCRWRTNASASVPEIVCGPAGRCAPDSGSSTGLRRHTSTPPIAVVRLWKPSRLISA
ncbi:hypothetical protein BJF90_28000 [Pseudonocardia sp. CNS-004]|nr:hypothetical protein BJF90_28000 [Pseudonocardia sp. CNS-004]